MAIQLPTTFEINTANHILAIPQKEDIPFIFEATRYEGFNDGMLWEPPEDISEMEAPHKRSLKVWESGEAFVFSIYHKPDRQFRGRISIRPGRGTNGWNLGFFTHPAFQGKGIMTEAVKAVLHFGFTVLKAEVVDADYAVWNIASEKVLKRNGMKFIEYIEKGFQKKGKWVAENRMAITHQEWLNKNQ